MRILARRQFTLFYTFWRHSFRTANRVVKHIHWERLRAGGGVVFHTLVHIVRGQQGRASGMFLTMPRPGQPPRRNIAKYGLLPACFHATLWQSSSSRDNLGEFLLN